MKFPKYYNELWNINRDNSFVIMKTQDDIERFHYLINKYNLIKNIDYFESDTK